MLFGANHLRAWGYQVDFFDSAFSRFNIFHPLFYPLEHAIINETGMGFKLDQATLLLPIVNRYDVIVCTGDSAGLPFLLYKRLGLIKKPLLILSSGLAGALRSKPDSWVIKFYKKLYPYLDKLTVYSAVEMDFFLTHLSVPKNKICFIHYGTDWQFFAKKIDVKAELISAVGVDTGRDYKTFFEAVKDINVKVIVACHPNNVKGLTIPNNVTCKFLVNSKDIREIFARSKVVVVPCYERYRSAGQMVTLEAASAGRPVVVSAIKGMTTAFDLGHKKHLLYVPPENPGELKKAIFYLLNHPKQAEQMGKIASAFVKNHYTSKHLAKKITNLIESL